MDYLHRLLFDFYPYLAGAVFLVGSLIRFDRDQYSWKADSSQMLGTKRFRLGSNLFHVGILCLFGGHLFGLLTPADVYHALGLTSAMKQRLAMTAGGIFGALCFVGMTILLHRRLTNPRVRATSSTMDIAILLLLYAQLILGLVTIYASASHLDGENMVRLASWAQHIVTFRAGASDYLTGVGLVFKLHIVLGLTVFLVFPFCRLVHIWSAPVWYLGRRYQVLRQR